ncbi:MAG: hypothetical protein JST00_23560 [Deltaproteobacteria bacterium]|nr:hypothetical protein [Deltaproteobacteria bacterium]
MSRLVLASYKLRFFEDHVRAVPARDAAGCPFAGPGVDVRGEAARVIFAEAEPVRAWLLAREPGIVLRSFSMSRGKTGEDLPRVLVTLEAPVGERPRVSRFDGVSAEELAAAAGAVEAKVARACEEALARRG